MPSLRKLRQKSYQELEARVGYSIISYFVSKNKKEEVDFRTACSRI